MTDLIKIYISEKYSDKYLVKKINSFKIVDKTYKEINVSKEKMVQ